MASLPHLGRARVVVAALLALTVGIVIARPTSAAPGDPLPVTAPLATFAGGTVPKTDGDYVIWMQPGDEHPGTDLYGAALDDRRIFPLWTSSRVLEMAIDDAIAVWSSAPLDGSCCTDIHGRNIYSGRPYEIATGPNEEGQVAIDGSIVVWAEYDPGHTWSDIRGRNLATGEEYVIATGPELDSEPLVSGTTVVWQREAEGLASIMALDLAAGGDPFVVATLTPDEDAGYHLAWSTLAAFDANRILWLESRLDEDYSTVLLTKRIGDHAGFEVTVGGEGGINGVDLDGDTIVYANASSVAALDLTTWETRPIGAGTSPDVDGRYVFWLDQSHYADDLIVDVSGFDLATGESFVAARGTDDSTPAWPVAAGGAVAWGSFDTYPQGSVYGARIAQLLPTVARPNPGTTSADWNYFPETGHYLDGNFRSFWNGSGGLPVFGYPLTEELTGPHPDHARSGYPAQYVERQRFEWHAENAGTPYAVLLGRLGWEDADARGLLETAPFQRATPGGGDSQHRYFNESGHWLANGFKAYWEAHGLEFGDPGVSEREALALFGYPLSEEFVDPATGLVTQYFERAVFEYHPANPDPYKILLRRLGAETLTARGW
jgi:hypothetical protein